jgi:hypothetical protein
VRIALLTWSALPDLDPDDVPLRDALIARGVTAEAVVWDDPDVDWSRYDAALLRSTCVEEPGERCLVFIDGGLSHAVRKRSLFHGGRHVGPEGVAVPVAPEEEDVARRALQACPFADLLYARVDLLRADDGQPLLVELELSEPTLFLTGRPQATRCLIDGLLRRVGR